LARDSALVPIMPDAPARFSTTIDCFRMPDATWHSARIDWSAVPPTGHGQMKVMGRSGYSAAARATPGISRLAPLAAAAVAAAPPSNRRRRIGLAGWRSVMGMSPTLLYVAARSAPTALHAIVRAINITIQ